MKDTYTITLVWLASALWIAGAATPAAAQNMCENDDDCPAAQPYCASTPLWKICVSCVSDSQCSGGTVCRAGCTLCGNGRVDSGEECDDGNRSNDDACLTTCKRARCGDGYLSPGENCDPPGLNDCPLNCKRTLYEPCNGGGCNPNEICARVQSGDSYCFKAASQGCTDEEVKVFNTVCAVSCDLSSNDRACRQRGLVCVSRQETLDDGTDGICLP